MPVAKHIGFRTGLQSIVMLLLCMALPEKMLCQDLNKLSEIKTSASAKYKTILDSIRSNQLTIHGNLQLTTGYGLLALEKDVFDYAFNANVLITYKGLKLPFSYRFSNGRSISRFSGQSLRTPSFQLIGLSPSYKGITLHVGDRKMDFSKYTYQNVRFSGVGFETKPKGFYTKAMIGNLRAISPADQLHDPMKKNNYPRRAFGGVLGFHHEKIEIAGILLSIKDEFDVTAPPDSGQVLPKENAVLSYQIGIKPMEKIKFEVEQSFSALTRNAYDSRIDILSHQTTYNMFGLFTKKASSSYYQAFRASCTYIIEAIDLGLEYETIDKGYLSLGTTNYDHNFRDLKLNFNGQLTQKISVTNSIGIRNILEKESPDDKDYTFILNTSFNFLFSEQLNLYSSYSNFKNSLYSYYRSGISAEADTLILSQTNNNIVLGANYIICPERPTTLSLILSRQSTNTISDDAVQDQEINNSIVNFIVSKNLDKHVLSLVLGFVASKSVTFGNTTYLSAVSHTFTINEKASLSQSITYNHLKFTQEIVNQITLRQSIQYKPHDRLGFYSELSLDASNRQSAFKILKTQISCGANLTF